MTNLLERWFGPNYRTSLTGIASAITGFLTMLAALPYQLGDIATVISPDWKARIVTIGLFATGILKIWNSVLQKDKAVTGGTKPNI